MGKKRKLTQGMRSGKPSKRLLPSNNAKKLAALGAKRSQPKQGTNKSNNDNNSNNGSSSSQHRQQQQQQQQRHTEPTIPFSPEDKILLVGDGDLSFAVSLVGHHCCANITATVLEKNRDELLEKYPHAADNVATIEAEDGCRVLFGIDATKMGPFTTKPGRHKTSSGPAPGSEHSSIHSNSTNTTTTITTSAATITTTSPPGLMDRIIFNFPHVGGKSTDVNRQVRYNQELLVSFFRRAMPSLSPGGSIIVTLFEGEPYTLWNVRDLARHSGLRVERSFRFQASAYPGYHHARTLGVVRGRDGEAGGGWKGEDRAARSYIFVKKDADVDAAAAAQSSGTVQRGTKRSTRHDDDSSDDD